MKIFPLSVTVRELTEGFIDNEEQGVRGYGGRLTSGLPISASSSTTTRNSRR